MRFHGSAEARKLRYRSLGDLSEQIGAGKLRDRGRVRVAPTGVPLCQDSNNWLVRTENRTTRDTIEYPSAGGYPF